MERGGVETFRVADDDVVILGDFAAEQPRAEGGYEREREDQGTAEGEAFDRDELNKLLDLALKGTSELTAMQSAALGK